MTSPISAKWHRSNAGRRRRIASGGGFTMIELLVVIGIIVVLMAILTPMVFRAQKAARKTKLAQDLQAIEAALDAYKQDFGDFPRVAYDPAVTGPTLYDVDRPNPPSGAEILCRALIGPAPAQELPTPPNGTIAIQDGADGPGFRVRGTQGKVYGPYLQTERFKVGPMTGTADVSSTGNVFRWVIKDSEGSPILYFPRRTPTPVPAMYLFTMQSPVAPQTLQLPAAYPTTSAGFGYNEQFTYDVYDNVLYFLHGTESSSSIINAAKRMYVMLNDYDPSNPTAATNFNGKYDANTKEKPAVSAPYLLWAAGSDGKFGTDSVTPGEKDIRTCDDVTNFIQ